jgi:CubicO group peptidase (beta-lactamase class C family)
MSFGSYFPHEDTASTLGISGDLRQIWGDLTDQEHRHVFDLWTQGLYRLVDISGYEVNGQARYAEMWEKDRLGQAPWWSRHDITVAEYQNVFNQQKLNGLGPIRVSGYTVAGTTLYAAIWQKILGRDWAAQHNFNILNLRNHARVVQTQGYRITDISAYSALMPNPDHTGPGPAPIVRVGSFSSIWERSDGREWQVTGPYTSAQHQSLFDRLVQQGWWPIRVSGFAAGSDGSVQRFITLWEKASGLAGVVRHGLDRASCTTELETWGGQGYRPVYVSAYSAGYGGDAVQRFCPNWEKRDAGLVIARLAKAFMRQYELPGLSLAVAKGGQLVYSQGFGIADQSSGDQVTTSNLFRIASLTKPITSVALMILASQGRLTLQDLVFGSGGHLTGFGTPADPRVNQITIRHLLQHASGGWASDSNDPMYTNRQFDHQQLITWVLANRPLDNAPGERFAYSNFGYCVLGRVIEQVTGQPYDAYVRQNILAPCGITDMQLAGNTYADRRPGEVVYYGLDGDNPYNVPVARMDSHGGWLATATDIMRFAVRVDGLPTKPDILPANWITTMTTQSGVTGSDGYADGWYVDRAGTWSHNGYLTGSSSILVRTSDGYCWTALTNTGRGNTSTGLADLMWSIRDQVDFWAPGQPL